MEDRIIITNQFVRKDKKKNLLRRKVSEEVKLPGKSWKTVSAPHDGSKLHSGNKHFKSWSLVLTWRSITSGFLQGGVMILLFRRSFKPFFWAQITEECLWVHTDVVRWIKTLLLSRDRWTGVIGEKLQVAAVWGEVEIHPAACGLDKT